MDRAHLDDHFFRHQSGRIVAALTRIFGVHNLALAEDVAQDAICRALVVWRVRGVPDNPSAWLIATARNRAIDLLRREQRARTIAPELDRLVETESSRVPVVDEAFAAPAIRDEQLRMMFSCCEPRLAEEVQIALVLNILCGFGAPEIASAFLTGRAAIEKRISRGKKVLATSKRLFDLGDAEFAARLSTVHHALYLLFNEGYHEASDARAELCNEAIRLVRLLSEHAAAATPSTHALHALMCLHAARIPARTDVVGDPRSFGDQDRAQWDRELVAEGLALLEVSARGTDVSAYHLEAAIAAAHASSPCVADTDWATIVALYDRLMELAPSPVIALNRAIAVGERDGPEEGLLALAAISDRERLARYPFLPAALGELEFRRGEYVAARGHFQAALRLARNETERRFLERRCAMSADRIQIHV